MLWPTPWPMTTSLALGGSHLLLPVIPPGEQPAPEFLPPVAYPDLSGYESLDAGTHSGYGEISSVDRNPQTGEVTITATNTGGTRYPWGTETYRETIEHRTSDAHPENTSLAGKHRIEVTLEDRVLLWEAELSFRSDRENFYYHYTRRLSQDGEPVREKTWTDTISRDHQ
jgi:hypothetical protein